MGQELSEQVQAMLPGLDFGCIPPAQRLSDCPGMLLLLEYTWAETPAPPDSAQISKQGTLNRITKQQSKPDPLAPSGER